MRTLVAIIAAALLASLALASLHIVLPSQDTIDEALEYGYISSGIKSESLAFTTAALHDNTYFVFGSSELATTPWLVSSAPDNVFQQYASDISLTYLGEAYNQSLWHTIAAGAYAPHMKNKKVMLIVSLQWFEDGGLEPGIFKMRFSYNLYRQFCRNPDISEETKEYVKQRLIKEGVERGLLDAADNPNAIDRVNDAVFSSMDDLKLRKSLGAIRENAPDRVDIDALAPLDFDQIREDAHSQAENRCTNNDYYIENGYWEEHIEPEYEALAGSQSDETLSQTPEYSDLDMLLRLFEECGLEPYVVIAPVNGPWYDYTGLHPEVRKNCYSAVKTICAERSVAYLDLSPHDYDPYYLRDIMHLGWMAWPDIEEGFIGFVDGSG